MDSIEEISRLTFAMLHLNSTLDGATAWMAGQEPSMAEFGFEDRLKIAVSFFVRNPGHFLLYADYLNLIQSAHKLTRDHAEFIDSGCEGSTANMREDARRSLNGLADALDGLGYPGRSAAKMRELAAVTGTPQASAG